MKMFIDEFAKVFLFAKKSAPESVKVDSASVNIALKEEPLVLNETAPVSTEIACTEVEDNALIIEEINESSNHFKKDDWNILIRNAQDGGTNSILASHVLKKTALILKDGNVEAREMKAQSEAVLQSSQEMLKFVSEIGSIARSAKVVSFNLMIEAGRHDAASGGAIMVVAKEMSSLSESISKLTVRMKQSVETVSELASNNEQRCSLVSSLFDQVGSELNEFKFLMARIEELSVSQCEKIKSFEEKL